MSRVASREIHRDSEPLFTGTHKGANGALVLRDPGVNFRALGVDPSLSLYIENETGGSYGNISAADEDTVTATLSGPAILDDSGEQILDDDGNPIIDDLGAWNYGDTYNIYATSTKDSFISSVWVDVSRGWKIEKHDDVNREGWRNEDWDIDDRGRKNVFGPGQPEGR